MSVSGRCLTGLRKRYSSLDVLLSSSVTIRVCRMSFLGYYFNLFNLITGGADPGNCE